MVKTTDRARLIKSQMILKSITFSELAREIGVSRIWVSAVVNGRANSDRIKKEISNILHIPYAELWGKKEAA